VHIQRRRGLAAAQITLFWVGETDSAPEHGDARNGPTKFFITD
jgi:hypothetical protein